MNLKSPAVICYGIELCDGNLFTEITTRVDDAAPTQDQINAYIAGLTHSELGATRALCEGYGIAFPAAGGDGSNVPMKELEDLDRKYRHLKETLGIELVVHGTPKNHGVLLAVASTIITIKEDDAGLMSLGAKSFPKFNTAECEKKLAAALSKLGIEAKPGEVHLCTLVTDPNACEHESCWLYGADEEKDMQVTAHFDGSDDDEIEEDDDGFFDWNDSDGQHFVGDEDEED